MSSAISLRSELSGMMRADVRSGGYVLDGLDVPVLIVGVTYGPKTKAHSCHIELWEG